MIRLADPFEFRALAAGTAAVFSETRQRRVRLTVNAPHRTPVYITRIKGEGEMDGAPTLLGVADGLQEIEFSISSAFAIDADADIFIKSDDGSTIVFDLPGEVSLVRPYEARSVSPEIRAMQEMLLLDQERRLGAMERQNQRDRDLYLSEIARLGRSASHEGAYSADGNPVAAEPQGRAPVEGATPPAAAGEVGPADDA